jgi:hypothetical protein
MYSGSRENLLPSMEKLAGRPCPALYNPADFAIHVIAEIPEDQLAAKVVVDVFAYLWFLVCFCNFTGCFCFRRFTTNRV